MCVVTILIKQNLFIILINDYKISKSYQILHACYFDEIQIRPDSKSVDLINLKAMALFSLIDIGSGMELAQATFTMK